ncbi:unnamed protein product [Sympodiomycopsis kandeliae]
MASTSTSSPSPSPSQSIPQAPFIQDVAEHLGGTDVDVGPTLEKFSQVMSNYKRMESSTLQRQRNLEEKIPDINKTLEMVTYLKESSEEGSVLDTYFELHDTMYAKAQIQPVKEVNLWLGANVMLSYPLDEAIELLTNKLSTAKKSLASTKVDLDFLRDQITTMEVNTARVHNFDVKHRRSQKEKDKSSES